MNEAGAFCEVYGITIDNRILEYLLENRELDFAVSDLVNDLEISKPKVYEVIKEFESKEYVKKSRIIGKTQLYILNESSKKVKLFIKSFDECLDIIAEEQANNVPTLQEEEVLLAKVFVDGRDITQLLLGGIPQ